MPDSERPLAAPVDLYSSRGGLGYAQFCSDCHRKDGSGVPGMFPPLAGNPTVASANPSTLLHITLTGWKTAETATHSRVYTMPGFAQLEDREIAEILSFVRSSWGNQGSSIDAGQVKKLRQQIEAGNGPATTFVSPRLADMLAAPNAEQVVRGMRLHLETRELLPANVGNQLNCTSCHLNAGTVADGSPFVGVSAFFPSYAPRAGKVIGLEERINGCFRRSMNGKPLPPDSADMQAMVAYFDWMKNNTRPQDKVAGRGVGKVDPALKPDPENGRKVYARQCAVCHGENGEGLRNSAGEMLFHRCGATSRSISAPAWRGPSPLPPSSSTTCRSASRNASRSARAASATRTQWTSRSTFRTSRARTSRTRSRTGRRTSVRWMPATDAAMKNAPSMRRRGVSLLPGADAPQRISSSSTSNTSTLCGGMLPTAWPP